MPAYSGAFVLRDALLKLGGTTFSNAGSQVAFELAPRNTAGKVKATGTVIAVNAPVGGEQGEFTQFEIELPVIGQPTFGTV
jgi:hypothetical protein